MGGRECRRAGGREGERAHGRSERAGRATRSLQWIAPPPPANWTMKGPKFLAEACARLSAGLDSHLRPSGSRRLEVSAVMLRRVPHFEGVILYSLVGIWPQPGIWFDFAIVDSGGRTARKWWNDFADVAAPPTRSERSLARPSESGRTRPNCGATLGDFPRYRLGWRPIRWGDSVRGTQTHTPRSSCPFWKSYGLGGPTKRRCRVVPISAAGRPHGHRDLRSTLGSDRYGVTPRPLAAARNAPRRPKIGVILAPSWPTPKSC